MDNKLLLLVAVHFANENPNHKYTPPVLYVGEYSMYRKECQE